MAMVKQDELELALSRCAAPAIQTLEGFLDGLLDMEVSQLAQMPGSPGQVLAAQFTCYARSSVTLEETLRRQPWAFQALEDALRRLPAAKRTTRRRKSHADPSRAQAAVG